MNLATDMSITKLPVPLFSYYIAAGFPSPGEDYIEGALDLNQYLIKNSAATFLFKMQGEAMKEAGILAGSILIVDRSLEVKSGKIVVAEYNGELVVRRYYKEAGVTRLLSENKNYRALISTPGLPILIWGVVTSVITKV